MHHIKTYCSESSIHGIPQVADSGKHWVERLFWLFFVIVSIILCGILISEIGGKLTEGSLITYISDTPVKSEDLPFIAITHCPDIVYSVDFNYHNIKSGLLNKSIKITSLSISDLKHMQAVSLIVGDDFLNSYNLTIETHDIFGFIENVNWDLGFNKVAAHPTFYNEVYGVMFAKILTHKGFCYSFNIVDAKDLFHLDRMPEQFNFSREIMTRAFVPLSGGMSRNPLLFNFTKYPLSSLHSIAGFSSTVDIIPYSEPISRNFETNLDGCLYYMHSPYDFITPLTFSVVSLRETTIMAQFAPRITLIDEALHEYPPNRRGCFLPHERFLKFFKNYTKSNCQSECLANVTLSHCGCAQFFMVREKLTRVCGVQDMKCYKEAELKFLENDSCNCLLRCGEATYNFNIQRKDFMRGSTKAIQTQTKFFATRLIVRFSSLQFFPDIFQKQFTFIDFLSYSGGALGLFLGFSFLSAFEIFYYATIRVISWKYQTHRNRKIHPKNEKTNEKCVKWRFEYLKEFFGNSSIHGMQNVFYFKRNVVERIVWLTLLITSLVFCSFEVEKMYDNYKKASIILVYDEDFDLLKKIDFPAITFNSEALMEYDFRDRIDDMIYQVLIYGADKVSRWFVEAAIRHNEFEKMFTQALLCRDINMFTYIKFRYVEIPMPNMMENIKNESQIEWFKKNSATWNSRFSPEFIETLGFFGFSYTFNLLPLEKLFNNVSLIEDFNDLAIFKTNSSGELVRSKEYPLKTSAKSTDGLKITFRRDEQKTDDRICRLASFIVHSPQELGTSYTEYDLLFYFYGFDFLVLIQPDVIRTDEDLRRFPPEKRECYFEGEKKLKFFKVYTLKNCEFECKAEYFLLNGTMDCVPFYYIRNSTSKICDYRKEYRREVFEKNFMLYKKNVECGCLPRCNSVEYRTEVLSLTRNDFNINSSFYKTDFNIDQEFHFKFKDDEIHYTRRRLAMTFNDFLAQAGGMMGLFAGISALSLIEVGYFFTIRLTTNFCRHVKRQRKSLRTAWT